MRRLEEKVPVETFRSIQLWVTISALSLAPLFFGSVDQLWIAVWTVLLSISTVLGMAAPLEARQARILSVFLAACFLYALVALIQVTPHLLDRLDDPIWRRTNELLGLNVGSRISSRAEIPPVAIGHFLLLLTSFLSGFFVGTSRRNADTLVRWARGSILLYALYGLVALALTPNMLLWAPKLAYQGSLTATFVNHNTAATFLGAGTILWFCWAYLSFQSLQWSSLRLLLLTPTNEHLAFRLVVRSAAALTCFFSLLLTGSRGGLICTCLGLLIAIGLMIARKRKPKLGLVAGGGMLAAATIGVWLSHIGRIGSQGLFDDARWSVYGFCIEAIRQRPLLGAGAGTFEDLLPSLRTENFNNWGVWDYAHSTVLEIAVEMGVPIAAMVVIAAIASLVVVAGGALQSEERNRSSLAAIAGIAVLTYLHSTVDFSLQIPGYLIVFAILLGCGLARSSTEQIKLRKPRLPAYVGVAPKMGSRPQR
jgi:O-antigen ligase